jgi:hypothetical protein
MFSIRLDVLLLPLFLLLPFFRLLNVLVGVVTGGTASQSTVTGTGTIVAVSTGTWNGLDSSNSALGDNSSDTIELQQVDDTPAPIAVTIVTPAPTPFTADTTAPTYFTSDPTSASQPTSEPTISSTEADTSNPTTPFVATSEPTASDTFPIVILSPTVAPTSLRVVNSTAPVALPTTRAPTTRAPATRPPSLRPTIVTTVAIDEEPTAAPTIENGTPTSEPTPTVDDDESNEPTSQPTTIETTTEEPTALSTVTSTTIVPSMIGPTATMTPTLAPTFGDQLTFVDAVMVLEFTSSVFDQASEIEWESATAAHILDSIALQFRSDPNEAVTDLRATVNIVQQQLLRASSSSSTTNNRYNLRHNRMLQSGAATRPLQIDYTVRFSFVSDQTDIDTVQWVRNAFNSEADNVAFIQRLLSSDVTAFQSIESISVLVEGENPLPEDPNGNDNDGGGGSSSNIGIIAGAAAGGAFLLGIIGWVLLRRNSDTNNENDPKMKEGQQDTDAVSASVDPRMGFQAEIIVDNRADDVSTLGDPVFGPGGMGFLGLDRDEPTASIGDDYDYTKSYLQQGGSGLASVADSRSRLHSTDSGPTSANTSAFTKLGAGPMGQSVFSDDASFEQQFSEPDEKFEIDVPPGKLGMVIDTPHGGIPVVHAIKSESILADRVRVGDRLVAVDGEDVTAMTAVQVSKLISLKADQQRLLTFVRARDPLLPPEPPLSSPSGIK